MNAQQAIQSNRLNKKKETQNTKLQTNLKTLFSLLQFQISHAAQTKVANHSFFVVEVDVFTL